VVAFHNALLDAFTPSMAQKIDLDVLWRRAMKEAEAALKDDGGALAAGLPETCLFALEALLSEAFDFDEALASLRASPGTARP
jgi:hypothetical protein